MKCTGCKITLDEMAGYVECDDGYIWCPPCAFKLKIITADQFQFSFTHWHGIAHSSYHPIINADRDIEFVLKKKKKKTK